MDEHVDGHYAVLRFSADCGLRPVELAVHYRLLFEVDPTHRGLLADRRQGREQAAVLSRESPRGKPQRRLRPGAGGSSRRS